MNTKLRGFFLFSLIIILPLCSCKESKRRNEAMKIVSEWAGKEILFPNHVPCFLSGTEADPDIYKESFQKEFKILLYVDSAGCSDCRLKLFEWKQLIEEANRLFDGKVGFLLYFQPKNVKDMKNLFELYSFDHPVFIDANGYIHKLNHFSRAIQYQCFLLDKDNRVLMIGNPTLNRKIWELYKSQIGEKVVKQTSLTTIEIDKTTHNYGVIQKGSSHYAVFTVTNTGNYPFIIFHVSTSCGCTNVDWEKHPIKSGKTGSIRVEMRPDETGYFNKTLQVYSNIQESSFTLTINGSAYE